LVTSQATHESSRNFLKDNFFSNLPVAGLKRSCL
jgi:hypothetical protein